jgi:hypothetical protein
MIEHIYELTFFGITMYLLYIYMIPVLLKMVKAYDARRNKVIQSKTSELEVTYSNFQKAKSTYDSSLSLYQDLPKSLEKFRDSEIKNTIIKQKEQIRKYILLKKNQMEMEVLNDKRQMIFHMFSRIKDKLKETDGLPLSIPSTLEAVEKHIKEQNTNQPL